MWENVAPLASRACLLLIVADFHEEHVMTVAVTADIQV